ncbi:hypothetical protein [Nitrosovibrio tenuis]|uniref:Uncharacterized protein n=1 Tax=Nitrosovibrio tenuis TaxID=1233 RepID=A0A1H7LUE2_9PROT|nr:hypothetical protein [Nitrosovibrio tenuis]SEL02338.1 hypothetical protein SAMN05216387_104162 [Nitrosovibrio tenuis]
MAQVDHHLCAQVLAAHGIWVGEISASLLLIMKMIYLFFLQGYSSDENSARIRAALHGLETAKPYELGR